MLLVCQQSPYPEELVFLTYVLMSVEQEESLESGNLSAKRIQITIKYQ
jgi:hypothetical protein